MSVVEISFIDVLLVATGVLAVVVVALSRLIRSLPVSEPLVALLAGVVLGPAVTGVLDVPPLTEESQHLHEASRLLLALSVVAVALRYPSGAVRRRWRPVALLLLVVMPLMAVTTAALSAAVLGVGLGAAALLGAALAPTDPVLSASVVSGRPAEETLPDRDREVLSLESGANDGLAFPLVIAALAVAAPLTAGAATAEAAYAVAGAIALGGALGWLAARALAYAEKHREAERTPTLLFTAFLALGVLGASGLLRLDGVLAAFAAGIAYNLAGLGDERARDAGINESVNRMAALPLFVYLGAVLPWGEWAALGWRGGRVRGRGACAASPAVAAAPRPAPATRAGGRGVPRVVRPHRRLRGVLPHPRGRARRRDTGAARRGLAHRHRQPRHARHNVLTWRRPLPPHCGLSPGALRGYPPRSIRQHPYEAAGGSHEVRPR